MVVGMISGDDAGVYDLRGLKCPLPVLKTKRRLSKMASGAELVIDTTDPLATIDIPHFCHEHGHTLLDSVKLDDCHRFHIRKG